MFFRSILELPCCKQSLCSFCLHEYVQKQQGKLGHANEAASIKPAAPTTGAGEFLPEGIACPQCASPTKGAPLQLLLLSNGQEASARYVDSPRTRAEMERVHKAQAAKSAKSGNSPLKVGDDHAALSRKMLPFSAMVVEEQSGEGGVGVIETPRELGASVADAAEQQTAAAGGATAGRAPMAAARGSPRTSRAETARSDGGWRRSG